MTITPERAAALTWGGYARISDDPDDKRLGVSRQVEDIGDGITRLGGKPPADDAEVMWVENDTGAYKRKRVTITDQYGETRDAYRVVRPKWGAALRSLRASKINALMVYDLDRLARDPYDLEDAIEAVEHFGATILSATASEIDLTTETGRMAARLAVMIANKASADTARRVTRAHLAAARDGIPVGGSRPFGFKTDKVTHEPAEADLIRQAATDLIAGASLHAITAGWQSAGVQTVRGKPWRHGTVRQLLKGPRLAGWRVHQGRIATDKNGQPVRLRCPKTGEPVQPILDQDTFDRLQQLLTRPEGRRRIPRKGARHYLLTGLARCGRCNGPMYGHHYGEAKGEPRYYYVCRGSSADKHIVSISGHGTDAFLERIVLARLAAEDFETAPPAFADDERLAQVRDSIAELMSAFSEGRLSAAVVFPQVEKLEAERDDLDAERDRFIRATAGPRIAQLTPEAWQGFDIARRRAVLEQLFDAVMIKPAQQQQNRLDLDRIAPVWRGQNL